MKKTYMKPVSEEIRVETAMMIAASLPQGNGNAHTSGGNYDKSLSPDYYDDEEDEEEEDW